MTPDKPQFQEIPLNDIHVSPDNPRKTFSEAGLKELALSIREHGVLEPILVRPNNQGYELIAGERRWRASFLANRVSIPAIIRSDSENNILQIQLVENLQREAMSYMETARAIGKLRNELDMDVDEIAGRLGKSTATVYNALSLLHCADEVQGIFERGEVNLSVAVLIAKLPQTDQQMKAANALRRNRKDRLISYSTARKWIADAFEPKERTKTPKQSFLQKTGTEYKANWKKYLLTFDCAQFEQFKRVAKGRTDTEVLSEAVEAVMRGDIL
jgi:ParB family transcriptional regulator, chromosome partitioning protein